MLIALYRCKMKTKRWYLLLIFHAVDIAKVNAWLLYRRHCSQLKIAAKSQMSLLTFISKISDALIKAGKPSPARRSAGRPPKRRCDEREDVTLKRGRAPKTVIPDADSRYDELCHWPEYREKKNKCLLCKTGFCRVYCLKCNLCLCFTSNKNCFTEFHTK